MSGTLVGASGETEVDMRSFRLRGGKRSVSSLSVAGERQIFVGQFVDQRESRAG
jgi:hypothetical protein